MLPEDPMIALTVVAGSAFEVFGRCEWLRQGRHPDKIKGDERGLREVRLRKIARPWLSVKDTQSH